MLRAEKEYSKAEYQNKLWKIKCSITRKGLIFIYSDILKIRYLFKIHYLYHNLIFCVAVKVNATFYKELILLMFILSKGVNFISLFIERKWISAFYRYLKTAE